MYGKFDRCILLYGHALYVLSDVEIDIGVFLLFFFKLLSRGILFIIV